MQLDVNVGMLLSNMVMFFIILATGTALFNNGIREVDTVEQAAKALEPVAVRLPIFFLLLEYLEQGFSLFLF
jgi:Mn2+/Fe2+ NRAMP family transporter